jgi:Holliday junction resolvase
MLEKEITREIINFLRACGCFCFKHWSGPMSRRGVSDLLGCLPGGRALAIECKRPGGRPTAEQVRFLEDIKSRGGLAFIAHSVDEVKDQLADVGIHPEQMGLF